MTIIYAENYNLMSIGIYKKYIENGVLYDDDIIPYGTVLW